MDECELNDMYIYPTIVTWCYGGVYLVCAIIVGARAYLRIQLAKNIALEETTNNTKHNSANKHENEDKKEEFEEEQTRVDKNGKNENTMTQIVSTLDKSHVNNNINRMAEHNIDRTTNEYIYKMHKKMIKNDGRLDKCILVRLWMCDVWQKRKCYFPLLTHIIDQMTDVGVIIAFGLLYIEEQKSEYGRSYCEAINPLYLFILSMAAFWVYRIASSIVIYVRTKSLMRIVMQLFDLELFRALLINYKLQTDQPSNPQRWIQSWEAVLEAFPQTLIQLFFVTKTNTLDPLIVFSIFWSLWSIISKTCKEDELLFGEKYQKLSSKCSSKRAWKSMECVSNHYVIRVVYRAGDVLGRVLILLLVWIFIGGLLLFVVLSVEFCALVVVCVYIKDWSVLQWILVTPVTTLEKQQLLDKTIVAEIYNSLVFINWRICVCIWQF